MSETFAKHVVSGGAKGHGESVLLGFLAGLAAAMVGAGLWMGIEAATGMRLGLVAIAIGAMVGFAVRVAGKGTGAVFGLMGALLTLAGCLCGEILAVTYASVSPNRDFYTALTTLDLGQTLASIFNHMQPISYFIYGIGLYEGWKLSIRR